MTRVIGSDARSRRQQTAVTVAIPQSSTKSSQEKEHYSYFHAGAEPGVNPQSMLSFAKYGHFKQDCVVDVVEYDNDEVEVRQLSNNGLVRLLEEERADARAAGACPPLPPRMVRWINIGGIDWDVLSALALRYNLHSLALEDILHERGHSYSKVDYYPGHFFVRVLCHSLFKDDIPEPTPLLASPLKLSPETSPQNSFDGVRNPSVLDLEEGREGDGNIQSVDRRRSLTGLTVAQNTLGPSPKKEMNGHWALTREKQLREVIGFLKDERVSVKHEPMFIFMLRDGTVISIHPSPSLEFTAPISERLHRPDSLLRTSEDPSLLVQSLLDLIIDRVLEMVDEYKVRIDVLERHILLHPDMDAVRSLHILSADLIMRKRTLGPIRTMISGLRQYDHDRCTALAETMAMDHIIHHASDGETETESTLTDTRGMNEHEAEMKRAEGSDRLARAKRKRRKLRAKEQERKRRNEASLVEQKEPISSESGMEKERSQRDMKKGRERIGASPRSRKVEGYFSYKSKVYLADVYDHIDFALTSLDMFSDISENLINYAFNMASYELNNGMKRLTLMTIIFVPLTLLTGYFGMNFTPFWSVQENSDALFWKIAAPVMLLIVPLFFFSDIKNFVKNWKRKREIQRAIKNI